MKHTKAANRMASNSSPVGDALEVCSSLVVNPSPPGLPSKQVTPSGGSQYLPPGLVCPAIAPNDRHKQRIILAQSSVSFLISSLQNESSALSLIRLAELAYGEREHLRLAQISDALSNHRCFEAIGAYYKGLAVMRSGKGDLHAARRLLEQAADYCPVNYRAKALLSLGAVAGYQGNVSTELNHYRDALDIQGQDISTRLELNRAVAFNYTEAGDYHKAIALLESLAPIAREAARINPRLYYDLLNNYAVNLRAVGRLREALYYATLITVSPLAQHIPEWTETKDEVSQAIAEQEAAPAIVVVPHLEREAEKESRGNSYPLIASLPSNVSDPPALSSTNEGKQPNTIQHRLRYSFTPHAPPFNTGK
jgi:hypothetical protein